MYLDELEKLINQECISCGIISNVDTDVVEMFGDKTNLEYKDMIEQLFGDIEQIKMLNQSLINQQLPRSWGQGDVICLVCKPRDNIIIGLFYNETRPLLDSISFGEKIASEIDAIWNKTS